MSLFDVSNSISFSKSQRNLMAILRDLIEASIKRKE